MPVQFFEVSIKSKLKNRRKLKTFIANLIKREGCSVSMVNYVFCDDLYLLLLNEKFLLHDTYTDVITFLMSSPGLPIEGEVYISIQRINENAKRFGAAYAHELHRVIFHGTLHLCGYSDKLKKEKRIMTAKEDKYLDEYFLNVPRETPFNIIKP